MHVSPVIEAQMHLLTHNLGQQIAGIAWPDFESVLEPVRERISLPIEVIIWNATH